jgi:hypothetical protein
MVYGFAHREEKREREMIVGLIVWIVYVVVCGVMRGVRDGER